MISPREARLRARLARQAVVHQANVPDAPVRNNNGVQHVAVRINGAPENGDGARIGQEIQHQDVRPPLEAENDRLTRENQALRARIAQLEQAHGVAPGVVIFGEQREAPHQARARSTSEERYRALHAHIERMRELEEARRWSERAQRMRNEMGRRRPAAINPYVAILPDYLNDVPDVYVDPAMAEERVRQLQD